MTTTTKKTSPEQRQTQLVKRYIMLSDAERKAAQDCKDRGEEGLCRDHDFAAIGSAMHAARVAAEEAYLRSGSYKDALAVGRLTLDGILMNLEGRDEGGHV